MVTDLVYRQLVSEDQYWQVLGPVPRQEENAGLLVKNYWEFWVGKSRTLNQTQGPPCVRSEVHAQEAGPSEYQKQERRELLLQNGYHTKIGILILGMCQEHKEKRVIQQIFRLFPYYITKVTWQRNRSLKRLSNLTEVTNLTPKGQLFSKLKALVVIYYLSIYYLRVT